VIGPITHYYEEARPDHGVALLSLGFSLLEDPDEGQTADAPE
jgi:hypothetical protein